MSVASPSSSSCRVPRVHKAAFSRSSLTTSFLLHSTPCQPHPSSFPFLSRSPLPPLSPPSHSPPFSYHFLFSSFFFSSFLCSSFFCSSPLFICSSSYPFSYSSSSHPSFYPFHPSPTLLHTPSLPIAFSHLSSFVLLSSPPQNMTDPPTSHLQDPERIRQV
ncbi:hypothetical protein BO99DRAFT_119154 [Aspergillus violaceofuscus CBS 115571]|uniref:Uncharacterized protein n=1 Tax=Aspergillus violaceofuscus (strain CBS 115571) TaxID=1450538 RepID=A0A2V5HV31_ASPV1|nr:hypothetical protein BO99DRAFT_119154 [Aspergillus violaceofuscus CBS 115571]